MWRRISLLFVLLRLYFALSPSYLHPDEHFQGPEVIAGHIFSFPAHLTWEWTNEKPIRSIFPIWLVYGWPLTILQWIWGGLAHSHVSPAVVFYTLRTVMVTTSFVLEDWALHELLPVPKQHRTATLLVASSYVTWTYQSHTFSNSIETLLVLWCLVLARRIREDRTRSQVLISFVLAFLCVLGVFNRITFPAFVVIPLLQLLPHFRRKPFSLLAMLASATLTFILAVIIDTEWYTSDSVHLSTLHQAAIITPWNNLVYNSDSANLAKHGLHPFYQHLVANLPQLLGPAFPLLLTSFRRSTLLYSAACGVALLSCFRHQEARFLLPAVPLVLSSIDVPARFTRAWLASWVIFNLFLGTLMGVYHQGGIVPAQLWIGQQEAVTQAFWWKTYSPPTYLLGVRPYPITTTDLMGMPGEAMMSRVSSAVTCESQTSTLLVAPRSATFLDRFSADGSLQHAISLERIYTYRNHLNLDDMEFGDDGIWATLERVIGRRGLDVWKVHKSC